MEKKRLFRILSGAERSDVIAMGNSIQESHRITIIKKPEKSLAMIQMREPVKNSLFDDVVGTAVTIGDDFDKVLNMAVIDAACNKGVFTEYDILIEWEKDQVLKKERENAMFQKTKVDFHAMDSEVNE